MIWNILQIAIIVIFPFVSKWLARQRGFRGWLTPVVLCYALGILLGNVGFFPVNRELSRTASEASILFAIPLLLYATNLPQWLRYANKTLLSFALCALSGLISVTVMMYFFQNQFSNAWKVSGMVAGLYTGGTPNMQGVAFALGATEETIILVNAADIATGAALLIFLTSVAHRFFGLFLPKFEQGSTHASLQKDMTIAAMSLRDSLKGILLTIGIIGVSVGLALLIFGNLDQTIFIMLMLTSLSVGASFVPQIRNWQGTFETGELFLLAFCVAIGSLANFSEIISTGQYYIAYVGCVLLSVVALHALFARLFKIDRDTMMLTATAALYGPAFVGQIATVIKNKELVFSGISMGLLGYAIGNYWGVSIAYLIKNLLGL